MEDTPFQDILIIGEGKLSCSLSVCLALSASNVTWYTSTKQESLDRLHLHQQDTSANQWPKAAPVSVIDQWPDISSCQLVFISAEMPVDEIKRFINKLESVGQAEFIIAIGTAGLPLSELQTGSRHPENIVGVNWSEPVHTSYFMEIVANKITNATISDQLLRVGKDYWSKDPYLVEGEYGIQDRLISALIREALYLVKNDYASPSDIDRACRNDAGTYLPFAGNFRYMDLMGTYLYGVVMEKLNKELSTDNTVVGILQNMVANERTGMEAGQGFYSYDEEEAGRIDQKMRTFGFAIQKLMGKYIDPT